MNNLEIFLETTFVNVRSSKRTDKLHTAVLLELLKKYPKYEKYNWKFEYKLRGDAYGGTVKVDIIGLDNEGIPKIAILCKCCNSSVGKNIYNFSNTTIGESARLMYSNYEFEKILFVNIAPNEAPLFYNNGEVRSYDSPYSAKNRVNCSNILYKQYGEKIEEINIFYDINSLRSKKRREDFYQITPKNITELMIKYEQSEII
jgi:hypothetical protein